MDTVIKQISEIEEAASSVMESANEQKKAYALEMEQKTAAFDRELDLQTEQKLQKLRAEMEVKMNAKLSKQNSDAEALLQLMETNYNDHHTEYVRQLFRSLTEE